MSLSTLKHSIYSSLVVSETDSAVVVNEAKLNIMHATYVTLQSRPDVDDKMGHEVFHFLFNKKVIANVQ